MRKYLHDYEKQLGQEMERVAKAQIPPQNKRLILDFKSYNMVNGISTPRLLRHAGVLRLISQRINKPFTRTTAKDYELFFVWMHEKGYKTESINTYKEVLKVFHKWLDKGTYPPCVAWIKSYSKGKSRKLPEDLLTPEDAKALIGASQNHRDRALAAVLWESGARVGEVGGLQLKHCVFDDMGCQIIVDGKTGMRRIRLVSSAPYLLEWINLHPYNKDPSSPLWVTIQQRAGQQLIHKHIQKILQTMAKRAGIQKPINPHHFRHSRATYMAQFLTEAQMKEYFGWTQSSTMAARYVHLSGKQVDDAILRMYGIKKQEEIRDALKQDPCPRCKNLNEANAQYCKTCWLPLTPQATNELTQVQQKDQDAMVVVMKLLDLVKKDPSVIARALCQQNNV